MFIPSKSNEKWKKLLTGESETPLKNFFFQMKVTQARNQIQKGAVTVVAAIDDLHALCNKFSTANNMQEDLESVFGKDYETKEKEQIENEKNLIKKEKEKRIQDKLKARKILEEKAKKLQEENFKLVLDTKEIEKKPISPKQKMVSAKKEVQKLMQTLKVEKKLTVCEKSLEGKMNEIKLIQEEENKLTEKIAVLNKSIKEETKKFTALKNDNTKLNKKNIELHEIIKKMTISIKANEKKAEKGVFSKIFKK